MSITATKRHYTGSNGDIIKDADGTTNYLLPTITRGYWPRTSTAQSYGVNISYGNSYKTFGCGTSSASMTYSIDTVTTEKTMLISLYEYYNRCDYYSKAILSKLSDGSYICIELENTQIYPSSTGNKTNNNTYIYTYDKPILRNNVSLSTSRENWVKTLAFQTTSPEGYVSLCPLINGSGEWSEKGAPSELSLVSGIDNASWDMNGIKVGNKTLFGYDGICIAADTVVDAGEYKPATT